MTLNTDPVEKLVGVKLTEPTLFPAANVIVPTCVYELVDAETDPLWIEKVAEPADAVSA